MIASFESTLIDILLKNNIKYITIIELRSKKEYSTHVGISLYIILFMIPFSNLIIRSIRIKKFKKLARNRYNKTFEDETQIKNNMNT